MQDKAKVCVREKETKREKAKERYDGMGRGVPAALPAILFLRRVSASESVFAGVIDNSWNVSLCQNSV